MSRYAFYFDASGCSGCKACQVACKDRNGLEVGLLWRRVYEVSGGSWERQEDAWLPQVYAYNLSVACNHCERAVCVEACPTKAIYQRQDGIVLIDAERCIGCKYCSWACPYGAPQYDSRAKSMTKCTFCVEDVEAGLAPACVAACPLRVLDFGEKTELEQGEAVRSAPPLPAAEMTEPAMFIQPHRDSGRVQEPLGRVANREEVQIGKKTSELPLMVFTVLVQMAVGAFIILGAFTAWVIGNTRLDYVRPLTVIPLLITGLALGLGVLASLLHLGHPLRACRAILHLRTSWLSREILLVVSFGAGWAVFYGLVLVFPAFTRLLWGIYGLAALVGLALIFCMARVYHLQSMSTWNSPMTTATFYLTAGLLGVLFSAVLLAPHIGPDLILFLQISGRPHPIFYSKTAVGLLMVVGLLMLAFDLALQDRHENSKGKGFWLTQLRLALSVAAMLPLGIVLAGASTGTIPSLIVLAFGLALGAQLIGRWQFYERLNEREL